MNDWLGEHSDPGVEQEEAGEDEHHVPEHSEQLLGFGQNEADENDVKKLGTDESGILSNAQAYHIGRHIRMKLYTKWADGSVVPWKCPGGIGDAFITQFSKVSGE